MQEISDHQHQKPHKDLILCKKTKQNPENSIFRKIEQYFFFLILKKQFKKNWNIQNICIQKNQETEEEKKKRIPFFSFSFSTFFFCKLDINKTTHQTSFNPHHQIYHKFSFISLSNQTPNLILSHLNRSIRAGWNSPVWRENIASLPMFT